MNGVDLRTVDDLAACRGARPVLAGGVEAAVEPDHYRQHPSGVECIAITEHMGFCLGNAVKYIWRAGLKTADPIGDLRKARWYIDREIARLGGGGGQ